MVEIKVKLQPEGILPTQGHKNDVAIDLYTNEDTLVIPGMVGATMVGLGIHTQFDAEKYGLLITPRSMMSKLPLALANSIGVVEGTYTGEVKATLRNVYQSPVPGAVQKVLVYDEETKSLTNMPMDEVPTALVEKAYQQIESNQRVLGLSGEQRVGYHGCLPVGTLFIPKHTRLLQGFLIPRYDLELKVVDELDVTERGAGGFGSTGSTHKGGKQ